MIRGVVGGTASTRGTEVNTGEFIVCGERAGSVAILRIAPRRFCFRSRCPDRFLPPPVPPFASTYYAPFVSPPRLFRESLWREETTVGVRRSLSADKGNRVPSLVPPLFFPLIACLRQGDYPFGYREGKESVKR